VLGDHIDAFANESYLATATQWESLRRLVALVDYHPAPPASAFTNLVLVAKPGASGTVPPGFAVSAATPGAQITFETIEALVIESALNELRPEGFDRNPEVLAGNTLELDGQVDGLALGEPVVLGSEIDGSAWAHRIDNIVVGATTTTVQVSPDLPAGVLVRGRIVVHARPKDRLAALGPSTTSSVIGTEIVLVRGAGGIKIGDVLTIADQVHRSYHRVTGVVRSAGRARPRGRRAAVRQRVDSRRQSASTPRSGAAPPARSPSRSPATGGGSPTRSSPIRGRSPPPSRCATR